MPLGSGVLWYSLSRVRSTQDSFYLIKASYQLPLIVRRRCCGSHLDSLCWFRHSQEDSSCLLYHFWSWRRAVQPNSDFQYHDCWVMITCRLAKQPEYYSCGNGEYRGILETCIQPARGKLGNLGRQCPTCQKRSWQEDRYTRCSMDSSTATPRTAAW